MAYQKTDWEDLPSTNTPIIASNLNKIENELELVDKSLKFNNMAPSDLNNARTFGVYKLAGTYTNAPTSSAIYGILIVYESNGETWTPSEGLGGDSWIWQEIRMTNGDTYRRYAANTSSSWSNWSLCLLQNKNSINFVNWHSIILTRSDATYLDLVLFGTDTLKVGNYSIQGEFKLYTYGTTNSELTVPISAVNSISRLDFGFEVGLLRSKITGIASSDYNGIAVVGGGQLVLLST